MGYDETLALRGILRIGHCCDNMDVLSNSVNNTITYLKSDESAAAGDRAASDASFSDLLHLQEYSLASLVCLLQQFCPHHTRGDAMWCFLMSELHVGRATSIEIPSAAAGLVRTPPGLCKFHDSKRMTQVLERSRSNGGGVVVSCSDPNSESRENELAAAEAESDVVASVLKGLESIGIEVEKVDDQNQKEETILNWIQMIRDLEGQVKERKEWAQQKAMQATEKLSNDLTELKVMRMEREETQRVKGKQTQEDSTMKRLSEMETTLKKASGQVDRANAVVSRLQTENVEIRAGMEPWRLRSCAHQSW